MRSARVGNRQRCCDMQRSSIIGGGHAGGQAMLIVRCISALARYEVFATQAEITVAWPSGRITETSQSCGQSKRHSDPLTSCEKIPNIVLAKGRQCG